MRQFVTSMRNTVHFFDWCGVILRFYVVFAEIALRMLFGKFN